MSGTKRHPFRVFFVMLLMALALAVAAAYGYAALLNMQDPWAVARFALADKSSADTIFHERTIDRSSTPLPAQVTDSPTLTTESLVASGGGEVSLTEYLTQSEAHSLLVVRDGVVQYEWQREGLTADNPVAVWQLSELVVSIVVQQLISEGRVSEETSVYEVLREFSNQSDFDTITVGQLLNMQSGLALGQHVWIQDPYQNLPGMFFARSLPGFLLDNREVATQPGTTWAYQNVNAQLLAMLASRLEQKPFAQVVSERVWSPLGAQDGASWMLDQQDGTEKAFVGLIASPRDIAKLGTLFAGSGNVNDQQVIPVQLVDPALTPSHDAGDGWSFSRYWWSKPNDPAFADAVAVGAYGQFLYIDHASNTMILQLGNRGIDPETEHSLFPSAETEEALAVFRSLTSQL